MKESYRVLEDGTVSVVDDNNFILKIERREYQDNIQEILESENTEELLKKRKEEVKEIIEYNKNTIKIKKKINAGMIMGTIATAFIAVVLGQQISINNIVQESALYVGFVGSLCTLSLLVPITISSSVSIKECSKEIEEYEDEIKKLDKAIELTKKRIQTLKQDKTKEKLNDAKKNTHKVIRIQASKSTEEIFDILTGIEIEDELESNSVMVRKRKR